MSPEPPKEGTEDLVRKICSPFSPSLDWVTMLVQLLQKRNRHKVISEELLLNLDSFVIKELKNTIHSANEILKSKKRDGKLHYVSDRLEKLYNTLVELFISNDKSKIIIFIALS